MAAFAFDTLAAPEIVAVCEPDNDGSVHVMKKLGMSYRETQRWHETDIAVYGMTADEWRRSPSAAKAAEEMSKAPRGV